MPVSVQVSFKGIDVSEAVEHAARVHAAELGRFYGRITRCDVVIDAPHRRHQKGGGYSVRVDVSVPGEAIVVSRRSVRGHAPEDISATLGDAFKAARRRLEDYVRRRRGFVKHHAAPGPPSAGSRSGAPNGTRTRRNRAGLSARGPRASTRTAGVATGSGSPA